MRHLIPTLLVMAPGLHLAAVAYDPISFGGSPTPIGAGARSLGMGGAFVAIADDATANTWNPAGMTQLERPEAALTAGYAWRRASSDAGDDTRDDLGIDHVSVVLPFHLGCQQTIGLAWQRQFDFTRGLGFSSQENDGLEFKTTTTTIDQEGSFATLGLSYAIEPVPGFAIGATVFDWNDRHTRGSAYRKQSLGRSVSDFDLGNGPEQRVTTTDETSTEVTVDRGWSTVLGVWWQATPQFTIGANVKPRYRLDLARTSSTSSRTVSEDLVNPVPPTTSELTGRTETRSTLSYPTSATLGLALRVGDMTTVSLDGTLTRWSEYLSQDDGQSAHSPLSPSVSADDYGNGWSFRVGGEHIIPLNSFILVPRGGLLFEETPGVTAAPNNLEATNVRAHMDRYYGATAGISIFRESLILDLAIQARYAHDVAGEGAPPAETATVSAITGRASLAYLF